MKLLARFRSWLRAMAHRARLDAEMQGELEFHMESYAEELVRGGASRDEALRRARIELGSVAARKEDCRESLGLRLWDDLLADLRYGLRMLAKAPGFTAIAVVSLALGIGANTIIFTLAKKALLDELAVPHPEQLRLFTLYLGEHDNLINDVWGRFDPAPGGIIETTSFSYPVYEMMRQQNRNRQSQSGQNQGFEDIFAFKELGTFDRLTATVDGEAQMVTAQLVSGNFYQGLEIDTVAGRPIQPADDAVAGQGAVAVISDGLWARAFGRSPSVIGKVIMLNLTPVTIIGVNPPGFTGAASVQSSPDVFVPLSMQPVILPQGKGSLLTDRDLFWVQVMGRAKPGMNDAGALAALPVSLEQAIRATMTIPKKAVMPRLALPSGGRGLNETGRDWRMKLYVLLALSGLVLLLACANIANLLLARSAARQREVSVRMALGAGRGRILRQVFTESLLLSLLGGVAGLMLGYLGRGVIPGLMATSWRPAPFEGRFDWKVFAFTAGVSLLTGLLFGLAPALQSTRANVNTGLKDGSAGATRRRQGLAGKAIAVFQISLSMLLVVGAGLFVRTLVNLSKTDPGFRPEHVLLFHIQPPLSRYPGNRGIALDHQIEEKLATVPGVDWVSLSTLPLLANNVSTTDFVPDGQPKAANWREQAADVNYVGRGFLATMGIPVLFGRDFGEQDTESSAKVAIVNRTLARKFFANRNPVGLTFKNHDQHIRIVGVCADAKYSDLRREIPATFYIPYRQAVDMAEIQNGVTFELRLKTAPASVLPAIRANIASIDKDLPLIDVRMQTEQIGALLANERLFAALTGAFGALALILACIGIYGTMAYTVARRTNEIGIRIALGAQTGRVLRMVLGEASWLAVLGIAIGLGCALWLARSLSSLLYGLKPSDPATLVVAAFLLLAAALAAGWTPAWRASQVQPMEALRHE
jgi:predicted permease